MGTIKGMLVMLVAMLAMLIGCQQSADAPQPAQQTQAASVAQDDAQANAPAQLAVKLDAISKAVRDLERGLASDQPPGGAVSPHDPVEQSVQSIGNALSPLTGGLSAVVAGLLIGIGRLAKTAKRRAKVIVEVHGRPTSPSVYEQVTSDEAYDEARRVLGNA